MDAAEELIISTYATCKSREKTAATLQVTEWAVRQALKKYGDGLQRPDDWQEAKPGFDYPELPDEELSYAALKSRCIEDFRRLHARREATRLIRIKVNIEGPYGVMPMGDPHIDAAGTDWPLLDRHTQLIKSTPGLFGANVGDLSNNWVGRLARLYGEQDMGRKRALVLLEGWLREVRWLWIDPGNHDLYSGADDPVRWMTRLAGVHYKWQGSRLELIPPEGASVIVNSRHDHPGHSMYHPTHGPLKASIFDALHDDIYTCGHVHAGAYHLHVHPTGKLSHLLRLSSYKIYDNHKDERGFRDAHLPAGVFLINPFATTPYGRISFFADPEEGASLLSFARQRFEQGRSVALHAAPKTGRPRRKS
jgi:hypothetical protein